MAAITTPLAVFVAGISHDRLPEAVRLRTR